jgi:uncharacterized protein (TIGR02217 family)
MPEILNLVLTFPFTDEPSANSAIVRFENGSEQRVARYTRNRRIFRAAMNNIPDADRDTLLAFFEARNGPVEAFYLKHYREYSVTGEAVGTGDNNEDTFEFDKQYVVALSETVYLDGSPQTRTTHYTIDNDTGVITFVTPPGAGVAITADYEYYFKVRFGENSLPISLNSVSIHGVTFSLVEDI